MNIIDSRGTDRKLPPFGRKVEKHLDDAPNVFIFGGEHAWNCSKRRQTYPTLSMPLVGDACSFIWPVNRLNLTVVWKQASKEELTYLATELLRNGATSVVALYENDPDGYLAYRRAA